MNKEYFKILKEINGLEQKMASLEAINQEETYRVEKLKAKKDEAFLELENLQEDLKTCKMTSQKIENLMASLDSRILKLGADLKSSDSKQVALLEREQEKAMLDLESAEDQGLELLGKIEELEESIKNKQSFLAGIEETIQEIASEVEEIAGANEAQIQGLQKRIESALDELPPKFQQVYSSVRKKAMAVSLFSKIENGKCSICKMSVDKGKESQVEDKLELKTCSNCGRIFIPAQSLY